MITTEQAKEHPCPKCDSENVKYIQFGKYHCLDCGVYYPAEYRYKITESDNMNYIHRGLKSVSYQWNGKQWKAKFCAIGSPQHHSGLYNTREELQVDIDAWLD